jgi:dTDP-4-dehydrorhamnose reductase
MQKYMAERDELRIVDDQIGSPTYAADLAEAILNIVSQANENFLKGIYHYANAGSTSWYGLTRSIQEKTKLECKILPIETKDYPTPAKRPKYSILASDKISKQYGLKIAPWEDALDRCLKKLR